MQPLTAPSGVALEAGATAFYRSAMVTLRDAHVPFLVGGAYSLSVYTGIERHTRDFDVFLREADCPRALDALAATGYATELTFPHWLGKAYWGNLYVDVIFGAGNGVARVDDLWFTHSVPGEVLGERVRLCPPEETVWSKAFIMERERFDGADVAHLLRAQAERLDWQRLLWRFGDYWRVLLTHLVLFGFIYPCERQRVPTWVMDELLARVQAEQRRPHGEDGICQGTLLSREQYLFDVQRRDQRDARIEHGHIRPEHCDIWTAAIGT